MTDNGYYGLDSSFWAYNHPGWKPYCVRCQSRKADCKKFNSEKLGSFEGDWICKTCVRPSDFKTPAQRVIDGEKNA